MQLETVSLQKTSVPAGAEIVHSHIHHRLLYIRYPAAARTYMDSLACTACVHVQMQISDRKNCFAYEMPAGCAEMLLVIFLSPFRTLI